MGDVAMTIPVLYSLAQNRPDVHIVVLTRKQFGGLFIERPDNVEVRGVDLNVYKGIGGLIRLFSDLHKEHFSVVADLHDVLRTKVLRLLFRLTCTPCVHIAKGRREKAALTRQNKKVMRQLPTSFERYSTVLQKAGYSFPLTFRSLFAGKTTDTRPIDYLTGENGKEGNQWIGIAPFAKHQGKIYPPALMERVVAELSHRPHTRIFLFGGGKEETPVLLRWENLFANTFSCAGKLALADELLLMSRLDVMLTMDSANMHMASLAGTPVVSIWGATHPYAGFMGWQQPTERAVQTDLECRPCSVFGDKPCMRGDYACMATIEPKQVLQAIEDCLKEQVTV